MDNDDWQTIAEEADREIIRLQREVDHWKAASVRQDANASAWQAVAERRERERASAARRLEEAKARLREMTNDHDLALAALAYLDTIPESTIQGGTPLHALYAAAVGYGWDPGR